MLEKNLITKASLERIEQMEGDLVNNLYQHANASLSKAHGFELIDLPYADTHGDRVGNYSMRITYEHINYYVPLELSVLAGKDPLTGISAETNVIVPTAIPGGTAWVTDFTLDHEQDLAVTNQSVLIPHTRLSHWETHTGGVYQVIPQTVTDSAGHRVANYVARVLVDGVELWLPCDLRPGGPLQAVLVAFPAINAREGTNDNFCSMGKDGGQSGYFWYNDATGGTLPRTFTWQYNEYQPIRVGPAHHKKFENDPLVGSGTWHDVDMTAGTHEMPGNPEGATSTVVGNKLTIKVHVGDDARIAATVRGKWTNPAGDVFTNFGLFQANDEDGRSIFSDPDINQSASHVTIVADPAWVDGYYYPPGPP